MATQKPLVIGSGTTAQFPSVVGDSLEIDGAVLAKNTTDSVTAFRVQNAAGTVTVLDVDTTNARVGIGTAAPTASLSVGSSGTERFRVDGATGRIVEYSDGVPANGEVLIGDGTNFVKNTLTAGTNIAVTNGVGTVSLGLTGTVGVANGGTGTATAFTTGSVVFAGASGVYTQDNTNLFWDNTNDRLGVGSATPGSTLDVNNITVSDDIFRARKSGTAVFTLANSGPVTVAPAVGYTGASAVNILAGTQPDGHHALRAQTTYANADVLPAGVRFQLTTASGTTAINTRGIYASMADGGYTGTGGTSAVSGESVAKGQGVLLMALGAGLEPAGNVGVVGASTGVTVGHNAGLYGQGQSSTARNYGVIGRSRGAAGTENIGVYGTAFASAGTPILAGGFFTLFGQTDNILPASGALVCDNAGSTSPIFLARNNGVSAHSIDASGVLAIGGISPFDTTIGIGLSVIAQGPGLTAQPASQEIISYLWNFAGNAPSKVIQYNAGNLTNQRTFTVGPQTYAFTAASTITNAATVAIAGAPIAGANATITDAFALWVQSGDTKLNDALRRPNPDKDSLYQAGFLDDMIRGIGLAIDAKEEWDATSLGTAASGQGSSPAAGIADNDFGLSLLTTGSAANSGILYMLGVVQGIQPNSGLLAARARVRIQNLSTVLQEYIFRFGFSDTAGNTEGTDFAMFEYDRLTAGSDIWRTTTGNDGTNASSNESAVATNTWYDLRIVWNATTSSVQYFINDTLVHTQTGASVPTAADEFGVALQIFKSAGTSARTAIVDYVHFNNYFNTPRG